LDILPTKSYRKGDFIRKISGTENLSKTYSSWQFGTVYQESLYVNEVLQHVIQQLHNKSSQINDLKREFALECRFTIVIIINNGNTPSFHLEHPVIEFANRIKADFDIDLDAHPIGE
jgi:hypothetical protein